MKLISTINRARILGSSKIIIYGSDNAMFALPNIPINTEGSIK